MPSTASLAAIARGAAGAGSGKYSCGGTSFAVSELPGLEQESVLLEARALDEAERLTREAMQRHAQQQIVPGPVAFPFCSHYVPSTSRPSVLGRQKAEESVVLARSPPLQPSVPSAPPSRQPLLSAVPLNRQGPTAARSFQPQKVATHYAYEAEPESVVNEVDNCEEAGTTQISEIHQSAGERLIAEFHLDPVQNIPYSEIVGGRISMLGSGEFGMVYHAKFRGQEVAIKELFWDSSMKEEVVLEELRKEVESFRHLKHKRLVTFIGACLEIPHPCLVTEYMAGGSLHHLLHVRKLRLPLLHAINMCMQLADGVKYLHSRNPVVVHRDLKTQNVVLDLGLNVKLCDFGLTESMERTHIEKHNNGGSPRYMAPELFDGNTKITEKVDLWAMGCIFIEIFGGTLPYDGINTLAELTRELLVHKRPPVVSGEVPDNLRSIIEGCHDFEYRQRPTASQVFEQLKEGKAYLRQVGALPDGGSCKAAEAAPARSRRSRTAGAGA